MSRNSLDKLIVIVLIDGHNAYKNTNLSFRNNTDFNNGLKIEIQRIVMSIKKFILGVQKGKDNYNLLNVNKEAVKYSVVVHNIAN